MTKTTVEILKDAKALLETKGWTQGAAARNARGWTVGPNDGDAACFCGLGAVWAACPSINPLIGGSSAETALRATVPQNLFASFNDEEGRTVEEVLAKFDEAIAAEEAKLAA
jgi:hypothetical protein